MLRCYVTDQIYNPAKCEVDYSVYPLIEWEIHTAFLKLNDKMGKFIKLN